MTTGDSTDYPGSPYPYTFEVVAANTNGCVATSAAFDVRVQDQPEVTVAVTADSVCPGTEVTVTANVSDWDLNELTFVWSDSIHTGPSFTTTIYDNTTYTVTVTHISGCSTTSPATDIVVRNIDNVVATASVDSMGGVCEGAEIALTGSATGAGILTYQWYVNGLEIPGATAANSTHIAHVVGDSATLEYMLVVTASGDYYCGGLGASVDTAIAENKVTVYADPTVVVSGDAIVCKNGQ
ncbi:MAG: hypothetical protein J6W84_06020, partial [Bacteroidales bacterium]|nr:hypothetical protein [Bacteroidales bacterium]